LVLNAITTDVSLLDALVHDPTVANVYTGDVATHNAASLVPHDGFLADFLMRNKGFVCR
ncbi:MAG TPA: aldehyde dehydrogenase, partial [Mycobacterium sp.]|nr:aldehyde dehydrogenase [Mycobacterium sp.]